MQTKSVDHNMTNNKSKNKLIARLPERKDSGSPSRDTPSKYNDAVTQSSKSKQSMKRSAKDKKAVLETRARQSMLEELADFELPQAARESTE